MSIAATRKIARFKFFQFTSSRPSAWVFAEFGLPSPPLALKVSPSDPDTLSYDKAMSDSTNLDKWMVAAAAEIASLEKNETWTETETANAKSHILPGTWVFKRKSTPGGEISKYKARYCVQGNLEEGEPETFAPVVSWSSVAQVVSHIGTDPQLAGIQVLSISATLLSRQSSNLLFGSIFLVDFT
jgi:hypothetical protein